MLIRLIGKMPLGVTTVCDQMCTCIRCKQTTFDHKLAPTPVKKSELVLTLFAEMS